MSGWRVRERVGMNKLNWTDRERFGDKAKVVTESQACLCVWVCVCVYVCVCVCVFELSVRANVCMLQLSSSLCVRSVCAGVSV